jgi:hypothetical protein
MLMPAPSLSYLRVYEPLRVFAGPAGERVRDALNRGAVPADRAGQRDREVCLRAQLATPRLLPGEGPDGSTLPTYRGDVLSLPGPDGQPLVCPLDVRPRAAAALLAFVASESDLLCASALPVDEQLARRRAEEAMAELDGGVAHVVSATWTVPLPWFVLIEPADRQLRLEPPRRVWWNAEVHDARRRVDKAYRIVTASLGDEGPSEVLRETGRWLERFDQDSVLELDYGGIVELMDDQTVREDRSAEQVQEAVMALASGDQERAGACYARLEEFWSPVAGRQRAS